MAEFDDLGFQDEGGGFDDLGFMAEALKDAPTDFQPSGNAPPPNPSFEVSGRYATPGATPTWNPMSTTPQPGFDPARALLTNEPTQGFSEDFVRGIPATVGGLLGGAAGLAGGAAAAIPSLGLSIPAGAAASIGLAGLGGVAGESARQGIAQAYAGMTGREYTPPGGVLKSIGTQGAMQAAGQGAGLGIGAAARMAKPYAVKIGAQGMRALAGIPEKAGAAALRDPEILMRAAPLEEAGEAYAKSIGGLESGAKASRETLGKSYFSGEAIANKFDEMAPALADGSMDTQTMLALRQRTMKAIEDLPFNQRDLRRVLADNISKLDEVLEVRLPKWGGARGGYRESKIAEEFTSALPLNKNLSPNVLRTTAAIAGAAKGLAEGRPYLAIGLPMISPMTYGVGIKGMALAGRVPATVYRVGAASSAGAGGSALQDAYLRQNRIPVPDPAFQALGGVRSALP